MSNFENINMKNMKEELIDEVADEAIILGEEIQVQEKADFQADHHERPAGHEHGDNKHDQHDESLFDAAWEKSSRHPLIEGLKAGKNIEDLLEAMTGFKEAFSQESLLNNPNCCFECSDERVKTGDSVKGVKVALAGEGLLLSAADKAILEKALAGKNIKITGHEGCGAAKLAHPHENDSDSFGYSDAEKLAKETGNVYEKVTKEKFRSPVHDGRALVVDGTLCFNSAYLDGFPASFRTDAPGLGLSDEYVVTEINALTNIALGDHGLGKRFTQESPFYVIISAAGQEQLDNLMTLANTAIQSFNGRAQVKGFIAPPVKE